MIGEEDIMKAYKAWDAKSYEGTSTIVFAESAGAAKAIAARTDACEDAEFTNIRVQRIPEMDAHYRGACETDWYNPADRKALVALGWACYETSSECDTCPEKPNCSIWMMTTLDRSE
jgi:hypothetical protein